MIHGNILFWQISKRLWWKTTTTSVYLFWVCLCVITVIYHRNSDSTAIYEHLLAHNPNELSRNFNVQPLNCLRPEKHHHKHHQINHKFKLKLDQTWAQDNVLNSGWFGRKRAWTWTTPDQLQTSKADKESQSSTRWCWTTQMLSTSPELLNSTEPVFPETQYDAKQLYGIPSED